MRDGEKQMRQKKSVWMRLVALAVTAAMSPAMLSVQGVVTEELEAAAEELLTAAFEKIEVNK